MPVSKGVDPKTMLHLHNGILCRRKKEGVPFLCNSMGGTGEHYAKGDKPGSEGQIPYDLTFNWNLVNKTSKQNITRDIEIKNNLTVTRGEVEGIMREGRYSFQEQL